MRLRVRPFDEFERTLDRFFGNSFVPVRLPSSSDEERTWRPSADIAEDNQALMLTLDLPGVEKDQISISVDDGVLTVNGERASEKTEESGGVVRTERWQGKISRSFRLPRTVDAEKITANLKSGVLTLTVPKKEEAKPRQIPVHVN